MLQRNPKKRAPIRQLREAAKQVHDMLSRRGVVHKENVLEEMAKDASAPILPGIPSYLPHKWTIQAARAAMYTLLKDWCEKYKDDPEKQERITDFFAFVVKELYKKERQYKAEMKRTEESLANLKDAPLLYEIFSPMRKRQTAKGLQKFFVDSFAVFTIVKADGNTTDYAEWFLGDWTTSLNNLWDKKK